MPKAPRFAKDDVPIDNPYPRPIGQQESLEQYQERVGRKLPCTCSRAVKLSRGAPYKLTALTHDTKCPMQIAREVWLAGPMRWKSTLASPAERPYTEAPPCG